MSKVVADNKLTNKSVNRQPYRLFTLRWQNYSPIQDIRLYRCHCFQHYLVIYYEMNDSYIMFLVSINKACIKLYDHIEQFISSLAMSKVAADTLLCLWPDNKLPNKSVNRLSCGLFTLRWQNNSPFEDICLYRCHYFQHYLVIYFEVNDSYIALF